MKIKLKLYSKWTMDRTIIRERSNGSLLDRHKCYMIRVQRCRMNKSISKRTKYDMTYVT